MIKPFNVDWEQLQDELNCVPQSLSSTLESSKNFTDIELLGNLNDSIVNSIYLLLRGYPLETDSLHSKLHYVYSNGHFKWVD